MTLENQQVACELNDRYREVFHLLVTDYIATSDAVGSGLLSRKMNNRLSPATIRNVMSDLEEMGFLSQPHTSAGRVPTSKGLRYYVDTLVEKR
ncbi:MAG: heat-inducible transcriptional repressor HrcA, partial [Deltaproteobacteria bacterium]|nr:heat-inducible transcriptional repressor HrcA [Deltaproteobacteria bacterium]